MLKIYTPAWKDWGPFEKLAAITLGGFVSLSVMLSLSVPIEKGYRSIKRAVGGEAFVLQQCSLAMGGENIYEVASNLGIDSSSVIGYCNYYLNRK